MSLLWLYKNTMKLTGPLIRKTLLGRARLGKEDINRLTERQGISSLPRTEGPLIWLHAASVGETQSLLKLIHLIASQMPDTQILVTSITVTASDFLASRLPKQAFHQYLPVDHPAWVRRFVNYWRPDVVLWAESELWPNTLAALKKRHTPVALLNARLSEKSFKRWSKIKNTAEAMLSSFAIIMCQTEKDKEYFSSLGGRSLVVTDNIKHSADPLPCDTNNLARLQTAIASRPLWLFASTHDGEEEIALRVHQNLLAKFPDLLTIIAPRHPSRRQEILEKIGNQGIQVTSRTAEHLLPSPETGIYLADTLGEMGLLLRVSPITCMGRSLSRDGGGGHNPLEPALLRSAVLHGPHVQNLQDIYDTMAQSGACQIVHNEDELAGTLGNLLTHPDQLIKLQETGYNFAQSKSEILDHILEELEPLFLSANLTPLHRPSHENS